MTIAVTSGLVGVSDLEGQLQSDDPREPTRTSGSAAGLGVVALGLQYFIVAVSAIVIAIILGAVL